MYGHVERLAEEIKKGAASVEGVEAKLWQVFSFYFLFLHVSYLYPLDSYFFVNLPNIFRYAPA